MKDAYSFHADEASLDETYQDMYNTYDVYSNVLASMLDQWLQTQAQLAVTIHTIHGLK